MSALRASPCLDKLEDLNLNGNCLDEEVGEHLALFIDAAPRLKVLEIYGQEGNNPIKIQCKDGKKRLKKPDSTLPDIILPGVIRVISKKSNVIHFEIPTNRTRLA